MVSNRIKLGAAEPDAPRTLIRETRLTPLEAEQYAPAVYQQSVTEPTLSAEKYYQTGKRLESENCLTEAIEYFHKSLACIPNNLGITTAYGRYLFEVQQLPAYENVFVSEIYEALARCLYVQKRIEDAWLAIRAAFVCDPTNESANKWAADIISDLQKPEHSRMDVGRHKWNRSHLEKLTIENKLTILMVTNFTQKLEKFAQLAPPGIGLVDATYGSALNVFGKDLEKCQKFLVYDRQTPDDENENLYQKHLMQFAKERGFDLTIAVGAGLLKNVCDIMGKVKSPYLLFLEHDWEFQGPRIDTNSLINVFERYQSVNYVRFNKRNNVISNFDFILEKETSLKDIDLIRTAAHSNNPHMVRVEKLNTDWLPICLSDPICQTVDLSGKAFGIEEILFKRHMQDVRKMGFAQAHARWGAYIYGQPGDPPRIKHLGK